MIICPPSVLLSSSTEARGGGSSRPPLYPSMKSSSMSVWPMDILLLKLP